MSYVTKIFHGTIYVIYIKVQSIPLLMSMEYLIGLPFLFNSKP